MTDLDVTVGRPADSIRAVELGDELSVFDAATGVAVALNRTAADVLALADGTSTLGDLIATLAIAYAVEPDLIAGEVRTVVGQLVEVGVLVPAR